MIFYIRSICDEGKRILSYLQVQKEEKNVFIYQMLVKLMKHFVDVLIFIFCYVWCVLIGKICLFLHVYSIYLYIVYIFVNHSVIFNNGCISILFFFLHTFSYY